MQKALLIATLLAVGTSILPAQGRDGAVVAALTHADPNLAHPTVIQRTQVTDALDLVIALGGSYEPPGCCSYYWGREQKLGLFLQERARADRVYALAVEPGQDECFATVQRATDTDTVIFCHSEKSERLPTRKFVYDVRAKALVKSFSYGPFTMSREMRREKDGVVFGLERAIEVDFVPGRDAEFAVRRISREIGPAQISRPFVPVSFGPSGAFHLIQETENAPEPVFVIVEQQNGRTVRYPVPVLTEAELKAYRASAPSRGGPPDASPDQTLGAWAADGNTLWFARSFYAGEGDDGFPGFGWFDASTRLFRLLTPKEIADLSVSAMDVTPDAVWLSLRTRGEWGDGGGGLLRFDRRAGTIRTIGSAEAPDLGLEFVRVGPRLLLVTEVGITSVEPGPLKRYFVDQTTDGRLRVVEARK